jgi:DNA-binding CsgD family transcriptional regulator
MTKTWAVNDVVFTERQMEIMDILLNHGSTYKVVGREAGINVNTVRTHLAVLRRKLRVRSNTEIAVFWYFNCYKQRKQRHAA